MAKKTMKHKQLDLFLSLAGLYFESKLPGWLKEMDDDEVRLAWLANKLSDLAVSLDRIDVEKGSKVTPMWSKKVAKLLHGHFLALTGNGSRPCTALSMNTSKRRPRRSSRKKSTRKRNERRG